MWKKKKFPVGVEGFLERVGRVKENTKTQLFFSALYNIATKYSPTCLSGHLY